MTGENSCRMRASYSRRAKLAGLPIVGVIAIAVCTIAGAAFAQTQPQGQTLGSPSLAVPQIDPGLEIQPRTRAYRKAPMVKAKKKEKAKTE